MPYDLLIKDALILDGTGAPGFSGDVAVADGKIAAVGQVKESAKRVIDAQGAALKVEYKGTVDKDTMKGTLKLGDLGDGTFTGNRKK